MTSPEERREFATDVVRRLRLGGFQALWAGGCVRDLTLGLTPSDYDVATDASPEQVMAVFRNRTVPVGISFGVVRVRSPQGNQEVEVATFRSDGAYVDGRRPESVVFSSPEIDASRRDFTINGMFLDPLTDEVIDYVGGRCRPPQPHPPRHRRPLGPIPRGQAPPSPCRPFRRAVPVDDRAGDPRCDRRDGPPGCRGRRRANRVRNCGGCSCTRVCAEAVDLMLTTGLVGGRCSPRWSR